MQLETKRLLVGPFSRDDEAAALGFFTDPDFMVWSIGSMLSPEAAHAVIADAFTRLDMPFVQAIVEEANAPSPRVLEKVGMAFQRRVMFHDRDLLLYRLDRAAAFETHGQ